MNRKQKWFDEFIRKVNGKGPCVNELGDCVYAKPGHPGCAVGCLDDFHAACESVHRDPTGCSELFVFLRDIHEAMALSKDEKLFLCDMQDLYDSDENWNGNYLKQEAIDSFKDEHKLV